MGTDLLAELHAVRQSLIWCWDQGWRNVCCESDSLEAVSLVNTAALQHHLYAGIIFDIRSLLGWDWTASVLHVLREANQVADFLAKAGSRSQQSWSVVVSPPREFSNLLQVDASSVAFPRF